MKLKQVIKYHLLLVLSLLSLYSCSKQSLPTSSTSGLVVSSDTSNFNRAQFNYMYVEALRYKYFGTPSDALTIFEECLKYDPNSDGVYYNMAQILLSIDDYDKATEYIEKAVELNSQNQWYHQTLIDIYRLTSRIDDAIAASNRAVELFPNNNELLLNLGAIYLRIGDYDNATKIFSQHEALHGINETSTPQIIISLINSENYDEALVKTEELITVFNEDLTYKVLLADIYRLMGDTDRAEQVYDNVIAENPNNPDVQISLLDYLLAQDKYSDVTSILEKIVVNASIPIEQKIVSISSLLDSNGYIAAEGKSLELILTLFEALNRENQYVQLLRPELLNLQGRRLEGIQLLEEEIERDENNYYAWENLLIMLLNEKDYQTLQTRAEVCSRMFNRSFNAKYLYALAANENGNSETALSELAKAAILAGNNSDMQLQILSLRADIYYKMDDYEKAFQTFEEAIANNANDLTILNNYAYYLAERDLNLKQAQTMAEQVIEKEPDNKTYLDTYGWVLYKRGKLKAAEKIFLNIISSLTDEADDDVYYEHLGYIYRQQKRYDKAKEYWQIAIDKGSESAEELQRLINTY